MIESKYLSSLSEKNIHETIRCRYIRVSKTIFFTTSALLNAFYGLEELQNRIVVF